MSEQYLLFAFKIIASNKSLNNHVIIITGMALKRTTIQCSLDINKVIKNVYIVQKYNTLHTIGAAINTVLVVDHFHTNGTMMVES